MSNEYGSYLIIIIFLVAAVSACLLFLLFSRHRRSGKAKKNITVTGGNISVFFDNANNVTLIPYVKDKFGNGKATSNVEMVRMPYSPDKLGNAVKNSLNSCKNGTPCTNKELLDILEVDDWKQFSGDKRNISVYFREDYGLLFNTTTRMLDGAYRFNINGTEKSMPADIEDAVLGDTLVQLLGKCR